MVLVDYDRHYLRAQPDGLERGIASSIASLTAAGKKVLLVEPFPTYGYPVPAALAALHRRGVPIETFGQTRETYARQQDAAGAMLRRLQEQNGRITLIATSSALCPHDLCEVAAAHRPLYLDDNHLSLVGARALMSRSTALRPH